MEITVELIFRAFLEFAFISAVFYYVIFRTDLKAKLSSLGVMSLVATLVFFSSWSVVQMVDRWQHSYPQSVSFVPLARFAMYQAQLPESVEYAYDWRATRADKSKFRVNIVEILGIGVATTSSRMNYLLKYHQLADKESSVTQDQIREDLGAFSKGIYDSLAEKGEKVSLIEFLRISTVKFNTPEVIFSWVPGEE